MVEPSAGVVYAWVTRVGVSSSACPARVGSRSKSVRIQSLSESLQGHFNEFLLWHFYYLPD